LIVYVVIVELPIMSRLNCAGGEWCRCI